MKRCYILRGLPGQGKTTVAKLLAFGGTEGGVATICSADEYFVKDGVYQWFREGVHTAHVKCQDKFLKALTDTWPLYQGCHQIIVVDNTNVQHKDYAFYVKEAEAHGFEVFIITVGTLDIEVSLKRNIHNVPRETLERMRNRWQP